MNTGDRGPATTRLRRLAQRAATTDRAGQTDQERCELCSAPIPPEHRHLLDIHARRMFCACQACTILFDHSVAGGGHFRLIPRRRVRLEGFEADELLWASLGMPVDMAFFFNSTPAGRVVAFYPSPMGATESSVELDAWQQVEAANPLLERMEPDVEALLVNRARRAREHWLVPVDDCYRLVAVVRTHWKGFSGGPQVWDKIGEFFEQLEKPTRASTTGAAFELEPSSRRHASLLAERR
jgi:Family of unknown function (DUF5947)